MLLPDWNWDLQRQDQTDYPDAPIQQFVAWLWSTKQWKEAPEIVFRQFRKMQDTLVEWRNERNLAAAGITQTANTGPVVIAPLVSGHACPECGKVVKTPLALAGHKRSHKTKAA